MMELVYGFIGLTVATAAYALVRGRSVLRAVVGPVMLFCGFVAYLLWVQVSM